MNRTDDEGQNPIQSPMLLSQGFDDSEEGTPTRSQAYGQSTRWDTRRKLNHTNACCKFILGFLLLGIIGTVIGTGMGVLCPITHVGHILLNRYTPAGRGALLGFSITFMLSVLGVVIYLGYQCCFKPRIAVSVDDTSTSNIEIAPEAEEATKLTEEEVMEYDTFNEGKNTP